MAIVALLSTAGCTNATLYASGNLTDQLAKTGLFPDVFGETSRLGRHAGLLITTALVLIVANLVDLSAIASVGSAVSLMVFLLVGLAGWRRRADTDSNPVIVLLAIGVIAIVLGFFAVDTVQTAPETFIAIIALGVLAIVLDAVVRNQRRSPHPPDGMASPSPTGG
jgi:amino acid transporter